MKKILLLVFCCTVFIASFSQKNKPTIYIFNEDWTPAKDYESSFYFMQQDKENDTMYISRYYTRTGPMIKWETYKDKDMNIPHGIFAFYNNAGKLDSAGLVYEGKKDKYWSYKNAKGKNDLVDEYNRGKLVRKLSYKTKKITYANGVIEDMKPVDSATKRQDSLANASIKPAEFKGGGIPVWIQYLGRNMKTPERFQNLYKTKPYKGTVIASFIIDESGNLGNIFIEQSCEWSTDSESIRVLKTSPKWKPAIQDGKAVVYTHRQSLSFTVSEE